MAKSVASRRLLTAIVRRAVLDFALYKDCDAKTHKEQHDLAVDAAGWLFFDGEERLDEQGRYSFHFICELLDLDPKSIRAQAAELTREDIQRFNGSSGDD